MSSPPMAEEESSSSNHSDQEDGELKAEGADLASSIFPVSSQNLPVNYRSPSMEHLSSQHIRLEQVKEENKRYRNVNNTGDFIAIRGGEERDRARKLASKFSWQSVFMQHFNRLAVVIIIVLNGVATILGFAGFSYPAAVLAGITTILFILHDKFGIGRIGIKQKDYSIRCSNIENQINAALIDDCVSDQELKIIIDNADQLLDAMDLNIFQITYGPESPTQTGVDLSGQSKTISSGMNTVNNSSVV